MLALPLIAVSLSLGATSLLAPTLVVAPLQRVKTEAADATTLAEMICVQVGQSNRYTLVTPEDIGAIDEELHRQLEGGCDEASCIAEIGGALGARYMITGKFSRLGSRYVLLLKLLDIEQVKAVNTTSIQARSIETIADLLEPRITELLGGESSARSTAIALGPSVQGNAIRNASGWLNVNGKPVGTRVRLRGGELAEEFTLRGGRPWMRQLLPGTYRWQAEATGYESQEGSIRVRPDQTSALNIKLLRPGNLMIVGSPKGAKVELWGPNRLKVVKGLPMRIDRAPSGRYRLRISSPGFRTVQKRTNVKAGKTTEFKVNLREDPRVSAKAKRTKKKKPKPQDLRSRAERIRDNTSFLYNEVMLTTPTDDSQPQDSTLHLQLMFCPEGLPGIGQYMPNIRLGTRLSLDSEQSPSTTSLILGYEHRFDQKDPELPFSLSGLMIFGQPTSGTQDTSLSTQTSGLETALEINANLFFAPDFFDDQSWGALFKLTAGAGYSNQSGGYLNLGMSMSWASILLITAGVLSGG